MYRDFWNSIGIDTQTNQFLLDFSQVRAALLSGNQGGGARQS